MSELRIAVPPEADGERLDRFLAARVPAMSRSALSRLIGAGAVTVAGRAETKAGTRVAHGSLVALTIPPAAPEELRAESRELTVCFEDDSLLVVDKPAGLVVHPGHGRDNGTLVNALVGRGVRLASIGRPRRPGIVHRLDRQTSGLIVVAKSDAAHRALADAFAERRIDKRYAALVWGRPAQSSGTIERRIGRSRTQPIKMAVDGRGGREARTLYSTLEELPGFTLLEARPHTGRTHQIRVHLQSMNHSIVGDECYGGRAWRSIMDPLKRKAVRSFDRLALHAAGLAFDHPVLDRRLSFEAPLPDEFQALLAALRRS